MTCQFIVAQAPQAFFFRAMKALLRHCRLGLLYGNYYHVLQGRTGELMTHFNYLELTFF